MYGIHVISFVDLNVLFEWHKQLNLSWVSFDAFNAEAFEKFNENAQLWI